MLTITRKPKSKFGRSSGDDQHLVHIVTPEGETIVIEIIECRPGATRLGISAPKAYQIWRGEIRDERKSS
jgi:hypothetical protein